MGRLIVLEGLDGSGKATLTGALAERWRAQGRAVRQLTFPRYGESVHADLVRDALYGRLGDLSGTVHGPALLFALDRRDAADTIRELVADSDILLLDRYVSSNAAYGSARLGAPDTPNDFADWVYDLEINRFEVPLPDLQLLLDVPPALARARAVRRAAQNSDRSLDSFEADRDLQSRTAAVYQELARRHYLSPWRILRPDADGQVQIPPDLFGPAWPGPA